MPDSLPAIYTVYDIVSEVGGSRHRIEYWVRKKLLPPPVSSRPGGVVFTEAHLHRARLISKWLESQVTLEELAERAEVLGDKAFVVPDPYRTHEEVEVIGYDPSVWEDD